MYSECYLFCTAYNACYVIILVKFSSIWTYSYYIWPFYIIYSYCNETPMCDPWQWWDRDQQCNDSFSRFWFFLNDSDSLTDPRTILLVLLRKKYLDIKNAVLCWPRDCVDKWSDRIRFQQNMCIEQVRDQLYSVFAKCVRLLKDFLAAA